MKFKLFLFAFIVLITVGSTTLVSTLATQPVSADLAVQQLTDGEAPAASMRLYTVLVSNYPYFAWGVVGILGVRLFGLYVYDWFRH